MLKRKIAATAVALLCLSPLVSHAFTVGLAFPTQEDPRWYKEGFMVDKGLKDAGLINYESTYTLTAGYPTGKIGSTNYIRILRKDQIEYYLNEVK